MRTRKLKYDQREPFKTRAEMAPADQARRLDHPPLEPHPWSEVSAAGIDPSKQLDLFKEQRSAIADKDAAAHLAALQAETDRTIDFMEARDAQSAFS